MLEEITKEIECLRKSPKRENGFGFRVSFFLLFLRYFRKTKFLLDALNIFAKIKNIYIEEIYIKT